MNWKADKRLFWLEAFGVIFSMAAASSFAIGSPTPDLMLVLSLYLTGSFLLSIAMFIKQDSWMLLLMNFYTMTNIIGIIKLL